MDFCHIRVQTEDDLRATVRTLEGLGLTEDPGLMRKSISFIDTVFSSPHCNILVSNSMKTFHLLEGSPSRMELLRSTT